MFKGDVEGMAGFWFIPVHLDRGVEEDHQAVHGGGLREGQTGKRGGEEWMEEGRKEGRRGKEKGETWRGGKEGSR